MAGMGRFWALQAWALTIAALFVSGIASADDTALRTRFTAEAPAAWASLADRASHVDIDFTETTSNSHGVQEIHEVLKISGSSVLEVFDFVRAFDGSASHPGTTMVSGRNNRYAFELFRKAKPENATQDEPWLVQNLEDTPALNLPLAKAQPVYLAALQISYLYLPELYASPRFQLVSVEGAERAGEKLVAVTFKMEKPTEQRPAWIHDGVLYLNPQRYWAIQECTYRSTDNQGGEIEVTNTNEFVAEPRDLPFLRRSTLQATSPNGPETKTQEYRRFIERIVPQSEFQLSAFDLPEPVEPAATRTDRRLWAILATLLFVAIAIALLRRHSQSRLSSSGT